MPICAALSLSEAYLEPWSNVNDFRKMLHFRCLTGSEPSLSLVTIPNIVKSFRRFSHSFAALEEMMLRSILKSQALLTNKFQESPLYFFFETNRKYYMRV